MLVGYTPGGSPIFFGNPSKPSRNTKKRQLFKCSANPQHKLTKNQAKASGGICTHCKAPLKAWELFQ